ERVRDVTRNGIVGIVHSQGHRLSGAAERRDRVRDRGVDRLGNRRCDYRDGTAGRRAARVAADSIYIDDNHVRLVGDLGHCPDHTHRSGDGIHAMSEPVIEAVDVVKFLGHGAGTVQALKGVTLALAGGELTVVMGPSGSGKTTLRSIRGCILTPPTGAVRVRGLATSGLKAEELAKLRREHIGFVFQSFHLFPTLTALDNVRLALDVREEPARTARATAREALAGVGLFHKMDSYPRDLSGGEQQRVAIARAVVGRP